MAKRIHFEDDIFYLNLLVRNVRDALALELDGEFFIPKMIDDLRFIGSTLGVLLDELRANSRLIERNEQFRNLSETEERFLSLLSLIQNSPVASGPCAVPFSGVFQELSASSRQRRAEIDGETDFNTAVDSDPAVVSSVELNELLKEED